MEKSSRKAQITRTTDARKTAAKVAMPARRAVSPMRSEPAPSINAIIPARNVYRLNANARSSAKLPNSAMRETPGLFFQKRPREATGGRRRRELPPPLILILTSPNAT